MTKPPSAHCTPNGPPPDDLKSWSKNELIRELRRQRALNREHAEQVPAAHSGGGAVDVAGDPHAQGGVLLDMRGAVLLENSEVILVDTKRDEPVAMVLRLAGRVNYSTDRADTAYLFGPDGAAAIVTEVIGLVQRAAHGGGEHGQRFAAEFKVAMETHMENLP